MKIRSRAKNLVVQFLKDCPMEGEWKMMCSPGKSSKMVHQMRVELSRMRKILRDKRQPIKPFKMIVISIENGTNKEGNPVEIVTLKKTQLETHRMAEDFIQMMHEQLVAGARN